METSASSVQWFSDLVTEDMPMIPDFENYCPMELYAEDYSLDDVDFSSYQMENKSLDNEAVPNFSKSYIKTSQPGFAERPMKQLKTASPSSSSSQIISFASLASPPTKPIGLMVKPKKEIMSPDQNMFFPSRPVSYNDYCWMEGKVGTVSGQGHQYSNKSPSSAINRIPLQAQDHVMAERKRREKLSQRFVALSAVIPGLKKLDKASVLSEATKYVKQLQERLKKLEEEADRKTVESVVLVKKKSQVATDDGNSSSDESCCDQHNHELPEIEARASGKHVLIRVLCERRRGYVSKTLKLMEKLKLSVHTNNVVSFGDSILDITILAQMEGEFCMTIEDLISNLRRELLNLI